MTITSDYEEDKRTEGFEAEIERLKDEVRVASLFSTSWTVRAKKAEADLKECWIFAFRQGMFAEAGSVTEEKILKMFEAWNQYKELIK